MKEVQGRMGGDGCTKMHLLVSACHCCTAAARIWGPALYIAERHFPKFVRLGALPKASEIQVEPFRLYHFEPRDSFSMTFKNSTKYPDASPVRRASKNTIPIHHTYPCLAYHEPPLDIYGSSPSRLLHNIIIPPYVHIPTSSTPSLPFFPPKKARYTTRSICTPYRFDSPNNAGQCSRITLPTPQPTRPLSEPQISQSYHQGARLGQDAYRRVPIQGPWESRRCPKIDISLRSRS